jgi:hypothetical protein
MRAFAGILCLSAALAAAPAFAQEKDSAPQSAAPNGLSSSGASAEAAQAEKKGGLNFGFIDRLTVNRTADRPAVGLAPIEKDQLELNWRPNKKWGLSLDLTSRAENQVLPREEVAAGAYYQVTPRFRFGGGIALKGDSLTSPEAWRQQEEREASVKIESAFSF